MGFKLKVDGAYPVELGGDHILDASFNVSTPNDSNARSTDMNATLYVHGRIITSLDGADSDSTINLAKWAKTPAKDASAYRSVEIKFISAGKVVRNFKLPNAFVLDYKENYSSDEGDGEFEIRIRQKKDQNDVIAIDGGWGM